MNFRKIFRKIFPWSLFGSVAFMMLMIWILRDHFRILSAILITLTTIGILATIAAVVLGYGKDIYQISGAVIAWTAFFLIWLWWDPISFKFAINGGPFWVVQAFVFIGLILLGKTGTFVFFVRAITAIMVIFSLGALIFSFTEKGAKAKANAQNNINRAIMLGQITEIETMDKERRAESIKEKIDELKKGVKRTPLSKASHKLLQEAKINIVKIYPRPKPSKKPTSKPRKQKLRKLPDGVKKVEFSIPAGQTMEFKQARFNQYDRININTTIGDYKHLWWADSGEKDLKKKNRIQMERRSDELWIGRLVARDWPVLTNDGPTMIAGNMVIIER